MICIRCRRETKGTTCEFCAREKASPAPARATGKQVVPPKPAAPMSLRTKIGISLLVVGLVTWGAIKLVQNQSTPEPVAKPLPSFLASPLEAAQKKIGALLAEASSKSKDKSPAAQQRVKEIQADVDRLALEVCGRDKEKAQKLIKELMAKYVPEVMENARRQGLEATAGSSLRIIGQSERVYYSTKKEYWVADVSGLVRLPGANGAPLQLFDSKLAMADAHPAYPTDQAGTLTTADKTAYVYSKCGPKAASDGYFFQAVESYVDKSGKTVPYDPGNGRNKEKYAFCAYPVEYGKPCKLTFLTDENGAILSKDIGGKPVTVMPKDLAADGW